jgi:hypothetical protein
MRYMLAVVLVVVAAGVGRAEEPATPHGLIGMELCDVEKVLGADCGGSMWTSGNVQHRMKWYRQVDFLGGRREFCIDYINGKVTDYQVHYKPFAARLSWLKRAWAVFSPPEE